VCKRLLLLLHQRLLLPLLLQQLLLISWCQAAWCVPEALLLLVAAWL
jgi:hypothetical protein